MDSSANPVTANSQGCDVCCVFVVSTFVFVPDSSSCVVSTSITGLGRPPTFNAEAVQNLSALGSFVCTVMSRVPPVTLAAWNTRNCAGKFAVRGDVKSLTYVFTPSETEMAPKSWCAVCTLTMTTTMLPWVMAKAGIVTDVALPAWAFGAGVPTVMRHGAAEEAEEIASEDGIAGDEIAEDTAGEDAFGDDTTGDDTAGEEIAEDTAGDDTVGDDMAEDVTGEDAFGEDAFGEDAADVGEGGEPLLKVTTPAVQFLPPLVHVGAGVSTPVIMRKSAAPLANEPLAAVYMLV